MTRIKNYFNTESPEYIQVPTPAIDVIINAIAIILFSVGIAMIMLAVYSLANKSPKKARLSSDLIEMRFNSSELNRNDIHQKSVVG